MIKRAATLLIFTFLSPAALQAATTAVPYLVKNINTTSVPLHQRVVLEPLPIGGAVFYISDGPQSGLWRSDGTEAGTYLVGDSSITNILGVWGDSCVWRSLKSIGERWSLIATDGSTPGTRNVWQNSTGMFGAASCGRMLCFSAGGNELMAWDGKTVATVKSTEPLETSGGYPRWLTALEEKAYFSAFDLAHGRCATFSQDGGCGELWVSDGTSTGTRLVKDINPGPFPSAPNTLFAWNRKLFFTAIDDTLVRHFWVTDGTESGTVRLSDASILASEITFPLLLTADPVAFGDHVYFRANGANYWQTDGTPSGSRPVGEILGFAPDDFVEEIAGGDRFAVLLLSRDRSVVHSEIWVTNWTAAGTFKIDDARAARILGYLPSTGEVLFTNAIDTDNALWATNGNRSGTRIVRQLPNGDTTHFAATDRNGFFEVITGDHLELWQTDGTADGTHVVADQMASDAPSLPEQLIAYGEKLFFFATSTSGAREFYVTDGTAGGTNAIWSTSCSSCDGTLNLIDGHVYIDRTWITDGTRPGTLRVQEWLGLDAPPLTLPLTVNGAMLFIAGNDQRVTLWSRSGTVSTPAREFPLNGIGGVQIQGWSKADDSTVFFELNGRVWMTKGTAATTVDLGTLRLSSRVSAAGTRFVFSADDGQHGDELWVSDGSPAGTYLLKEIVPGPGGSIILPIGTWHQLFFFEPAMTGELWRSDGTSEGTFSLGNVDGPRGIEAIQDIGTSLLLVARQGLGAAVWSTDGTREGTQLRHKIKTFALLQAPFQSGDGDVYVPYRDQNGTHFLNARTLITVDLPAVNLEISNIDAPFVATTTRLFFPARTLEVGMELWGIPWGKADPPTPPRIDVSYVGNTLLSRSLRAAVFKVVLSGETLLDATVHFSTFDSTAVAGRDYRSASGTVQLSVRQRSRSIVVPIESGGSGTFGIALSTPENTLIGVGTALIEIQPGRRRAVRGNGS